MKANNKAIKQTKQQKIRETKPRRLVNLKLEGQDKNRSQPSKILT